MFSLTPDTVITGAVTWSFLMFLFMVTRMAPRMALTKREFFEDVGPVALIGVLAFFTGAISFRRWFDPSPEVSAAAFVALAVSATFLAYRVWKRTQHGH